MPAGLAKVPTGELAEFISVCIEPRPRRPRARHLLKHPYFHTIRAEKAAVKLGAEALAHSISCAADLHQMVADCTASVAGSVSRTSSELAEVSAICQVHSPYICVACIALGWTSSSSSRKSENDAFVVVGSSAGASIASLSEKSVIQTRL